MKTKQEVLKENGYEEMIGYCFAASPADSDMLTFVEKDIVFKTLEKGVQIYYWDGSKERLMDLDEAWECFQENYIDELENADEAEKVAQLEDNMFIEYYLTKKEMPK